MKRRWLVETWCGLAMVSAAIYAGCFGAAAIFIALLRYARG